jgi:N-acetyl sugar amidotransferase
MHPYGLILDDQGVCSGCRVHEEKDFLDWNSRFETLKKIVISNTKQTKKSQFDCIIPVTGGGDSYFIVHTVKNVLGMNPLLVHYNSHYNTKIGIRNLANLSTVFDCDIVTSTPAPAVLKRITRETLRQYGSMYWQVLAGYLTYPVQVAVKYRIPLIVWGVHPWSDQTGMFSHLDEMEMTERCRVEHGLMGIYGKELLSGKDVQPSDLIHFTYPEDSHLEAVGVRGIFLSNYVRWDAKSQHEKMIDLYGYESAAQARTFNTYEDVHCFHSAGLHDYLKFIKLGYGKVTDHASREIRLRRMTREEGLAMVRKYSEIVPPDIKYFLDWIEMDEAELLAHVNDRRDAAIWQKESDGSWKLLDSVLNHANESGIDEVRLPRLEDCVYRLTPTAEPSPEDAYLLMGRGYIDKNNYGARDCQPEGGGMTPRLWTSPSIVQEHLNEIL